VRRGLTLVEVLVALAVLALTLSAVLTLQATALRAERASALRRDLAARVANEMRFQRLSPSPACAAQGTLPAGWRCEAAHTCLTSSVGCDAWIVRVRVEATNGAALAAVTAAAPALESAAVATP